MKRVFICFAACLMGASTLTAEVDRKVQPPAEPLPTATFPEFKEVTLENGLKVFLLQSDKQPTVTFRVVVRSGTASDGKEPGLAAMVAALLNKGTAKFSAEEFATRADRLGISVEATASDDAIYVTATGLSKYAPQVLEFLAEAVLKPKFATEHLEKERLKALSQIEAEKKEPAALASKLRDQVIFGRHPYGAHPTAQTVQRISREDVVAFHKRYFVANNVSLGVVGEFDPAILLPKIKETFGSWPRGKVTPVAPPSVDLKGVRIHLVDRPGSVQSNIIVATKGIRRNNTDTPELTVVNSVLGGGFSGRLFQNLRERNGFTYGSSSGFDQRKLGGVFSATAEVRNEVTGKAIVEVLNELRRIRSDLIPAPELALQKQYVAGNYLLSLENEGRNLERVQDIDLYDMPNDYYQKLIPRVERLDAQEAQSLAQRYLTSENVAIIVVGDAASIKPQLDTLGKVTVYNSKLEPAKTASPAAQAHAE